MCGRFGLDVHDPKLRDAKAVYLRELASDAWEDAHSFDARPSTMRAIVIPVLGGPDLTMARWGWRAPWMKDLLINANWESAPDTSTLKVAVQERRCAIPATCYYEWKRDAQEKPLAKYAFRQVGGAPLLMAGLWEQTMTGLGAERRFLILTRAMVTHTAVHDRMPVLLSEAAAQAWLDPRAPAAEVRRAAGHSGDADLVMREVRADSDAEKRNTAELMVPIGDQWPD